MIIKIAEYKILEGELEAVLTAIKEFTTEVSRHEPDTFYEAFRREDSLEFVHLMKFQDEESEKNHAKAGYTEKFVSVLYPRCENPPRFTKLNSIG